MNLEERFANFEISLLNQPLEIDFEVEPLTAIEWAKRRWHVEARVIEGGEDDQTRSQTT